MNDVRTICVSAESDGQRLDNWLKTQLKGVPKSHIYRIIRTGEVRINRGRAKALSRVAAGDMVRIPPIRTASQLPVHVSQGLTNTLAGSIIYEDRDFLVVNKPCGMAVHGGSGVSVGVIEALRKIRTDLAYLELAHRLDRETSGCLVLVKKKSMLRSLHALIADRKVKKTYLALLEHPWEGKKTCTVRAALEKNILTSGERMVRVNADEGKEAHTVFTLVENFAKNCYVNIQIMTGRTHQIRVHGAHIGHPVVGDDKYGSKAPAALPARMYLHAYSISFDINDKAYHFVAEPDNIFTSAVKILRDRSEAL